MNPHAQHQRNFAELWYEQNTLNKANFSGGADIHSRNYV